MNRDNVFSCICNRYLGLIALLVAMLYVHINLIQIHPLLFLIWPMSFWLIIELFTNWKPKSSRIILFIVTFILHLIATQLLVVDNVGGIFFDLETFPNMTAISYFVLLEVVIIYLYDAFTVQGINFKDIPTYVGFASVIPWISPALIEMLILVRWSIDGTFKIRTIDKGLGAASLNDILFIYGYRNLIFASALFYSIMFFRYLLNLMNTRSEHKKEKRLIEEKEREWFINAWENPLTLLSVKEQRIFIESYSYLGEEQRNQLLRQQVLPKKGIVLVDPESIN